jgi:hypothetical protein
MSKTTKIVVNYKTRSFINISVFSPSKGLDRIFKNNVCTKKVEISVPSNNALRGDMLVKNKKTCYLRTKQVASQNFFTRYASILLKITKTKRKKNIRFLLAKPFVSSDF